MEIIKQIENSRIILLVEDEAIIAMGKQQELEKYGYKVLIENSGEHVVDFIRKHDEVDLILMDIDLGKGIDGTETAELILKEKEIPIVFLSSHTEPAIVEKTEKITSYGYIVKNSSITVLDASIKMAFKFFNAKIMLKTELSNRIKTEERLKEKKSRAWLENSPACTKIVDLDFNLQYMSAAGVRGLKIDDVSTLYGKSYPFSFYPESFKTLMIGNLNKVKETGEMTTQEGYVYDTEKNTVWFHSTLVPINDEQGKIEYIIVVSYDITEQYETRIALQKSETEYKLTLDNLVEGVVLKNMDSSIILSNIEAHKIFGLSEEQMMDKKTIDPVWEFVYEDKSKMDVEDYPVNLVISTKQPLHNYITGIKRPNRNFITWVKVNAEPIFSKNGEMEKVIVNFSDITETHKNDITLIENEKKYKALFERVTDAIFFYDPDTSKIIEANDATAEMYGYEKSELLGMSCIEFSAEPKKSSAALEKIRNQREIHIPCRIHKKKDGTQIYVELDGYAIPLGGRDIMFAVTKDITKRKNTEELLKNSEDRFRRLAENAQDMIYRMSLSSGEYEYVSSASHNIFGYSPQEFYDSPLLIKNVIHPDWYRYFDEQWALLQAGDMPPFYEYQIIDKSENMKWLRQSNALVYDKDKNPIAIEGIISDITAQKNTMLKLKHQLLEKEIILKEVHHRIKNNISSIGSLLMLHMDTIKNTEAANILKEAAGRVQSMQVLYEKLLISDDYQETSIKTYLDNLIFEILKIFPKNKKIMVTKNINDFQISANQLFLIGIIVNELLNNSIKYAFLEKDSGNIFISMKRENKKVELKIQDDGIGLAEDFNLEKSDRFGLRLVTMLCQQLNGKFRIENNNGTKNTVNFNL